MPKSSREDVIVYKIQYYDKSKGSVFAGLAESDIKRFVERNQKLFSRNDPHKFMKSQL